jgi:hypothetical protein
VQYAESGRLRAVLVASFDVLQPNVFGWSADFDPFTVNPEPHRSATACQPTPDGLVPTTTPQLVPPQPLNPVPVALHIGRPWVPLSKDASLGGEHLGRSAAALCDQLSREKLVGLAHMGLT